MDRHNKGRLIAVRLCAIVLAAWCVVASAGARTLAASAASGDRSDTRSMLAVVRRFTGSFGPPRRDSVRAGRRRTTADRGVFREFEKAWRNSTDGHSGRESVVLIFRTEGGGYEAKLQRFTNEFRHAEFRWDPAAIAIVHTHPDGCDPRPSEQDKRVADRYGVPNFTITSSGMYVYDPATRKTSKVFNDLDWLKPANLAGWTQEMARQAGHAFHEVP